MTALAIKQLNKRATGQPVSIDEVRIELLASGRESQVLKFLGSRPSHTAYMAGLIHANGLVSSENRGSFYAYKNRVNEIEGVALVGHAVTFEASSHDAAFSLGRISSKHNESALIRGESNRINVFWRHYQYEGHQINNVCEEQLLELTNPIPSHDPTCKLRPATIAELDQALEMNLDLVKAERGNDGPPLDLAGMRKRLSQRIENQQVWTWAPDGEVIFKAEIIARTPEVIYLEGIFVASRYRGKGYGLRSLRQLARNLLTDAKRLCVFVNADNSAAVSLYTKVGYEAIGDYKTLYLKR